MTRLWFQINVKTALGVFSLQNLGIIVGIGCLYTLAKFQVRFFITFSVNIKIIEHQLKFLLYRPNCWTGKYLPTLLKIVSNCSISELPLPWKRSEFWTFGKGPKKVRIWRFVTPTIMIIIGKTSLLFLRV